MATFRTLEFGAINIVLPKPHGPERYIELLNLAREEGKTARLRGDWVGVLGSARVERHADIGAVVRGDFYKYLDLDQTRDWYNVVSRKPAEDQELAKINIPSELKPHFQFLPFVFFVNRHRLICVTKDGKDMLSVAQTAKILDYAFASKAIKERFGLVEVTVEPKLETLDEIIRMPQLRTLTMEVKKPNPDDFEDAESDFLEEMEEQNARTLKVEVAAEPGKTLIPNEKTKTIAKIAASNGEVTGRGGARGKTQTLSTSEHPFVAKEKMNVDLEARPAFILGKAAEILRKLIP